MADDKVYTPEVVADAEFPTSEIIDTSVSQSTSNDTYSPQTTKATSFPKKVVAVETIGSALNTKSRKILADFQFTESGAISVGKYTNGVSGDIRITPNGITARDSAGLTTFSIDGDSGDATFKGTIQAETFISGAVIVGDNNVVIDGENKNIIVNDGDNDRILIGYQQGGF